MRRWNSLDEIQLELDRNPRGELKRDVLVGVSPTVTPGAGNDAHRAGFLNPLLWIKRETVQARLNSNSVEFDGIKTGVVEPLPDAEKLNRVASAQPVPHEIIRAFGILEPSDVCEADEVLFLLGKDGDGRPLNFNRGFFGLTHDFRWFLIPSNSRE